MLLFMESTWKLNTGELGPEFVTAIRNAYPGREVEIIVREAVDETEYLLRSPANRKRLLKAVEHVENGTHLVSFNNPESAMQNVLGSL
jgi:antitoxin YefM